MSSGLIQVCKGFWVGLYPDGVIGERKKNLLK